MFQNTLKAENTLIHLSINPGKNNPDFEVPFSSQEIDAPDSFLISAIKLKTDSFYLEEITKSISISEQILEKSLGQTKAPQKRGVKLTGRAFAGYTGVGKSHLGIAAAHLVLEQANAHLSGGGLVLITTPIVDTAQSFEDNIRKYRYGTNRSLPVFLYRENHLDQESLIDLRQRVDNGQLIFLLFHL